MIPTSVKTNQLVDFVNFFESIICRNDELSCLLKDSELFTLFAENSQIILKISVTPIFLTFMYLVALESVSKQPTQLIAQLNSSLRQIIDSFVFYINFFLPKRPSRP